MKFMQVAMDSQKLSAVKMDSWCHSPLLNGGKIKADILVGLSLTSQFVYCNHQNYYSDTLAYCDHRYMYLFYIIKFTIPAFEKRMS